MAKNNSVSPKIIAWFSIVAMGVGIVTLLVIAHAAATWSRSLAPARSIIITGEGKATLTPNKATVSFSVVSEGADVTVLQKDNTEKINTAIQFIKEQGIADTDIKTQGYTVSPRYTYDPKTGKSTIDGYSLTQTVVVTVRALDLVDTILGKLPSLGINQISGPSFSVDDPDQFLQEARAQAFGNARKKAEQLAAVSGVSLGRVITFSESHGGQPPIMYAREMTLGKGGADAPVPPDIQPGSEDVAVTVSVTYEIR